MMCGVESTSASPEDASAVTTTPKPGTEKPTSCCEFSIVGPRTPSARPGEIVLRDVDRGRSVEPEQRERAVGREVTRAAMERKAEVRGALDPELHDDRLDEHLLPRRVETFDHTLERGVVV